MLVLEFPVALEPIDEEILEVEPCNRASFDEATPDPKEESAGKSSFWITNSSAFGYRTPPKVVDAVNDILATLENVLTWQLDPINEYNTYCDDNDGKSDILDVWALPLVVSKYLRIAIVAFIQRTRL